MKHFTKIFALFVFAYSLAACETIYFVKGSSQNAEISSDKWHHGGGILGLIEFSSPYSPTQACNSKQWEAVKTELSFGAGFVGGIVPYGIYRPWEVGVRCAN